MKNTRSELYKILSLPLFWRGVAIVIGITIFFTFQNIQVINAIANGNTEILMLEDTTSQLTEFQTVRDAVLSSPYQSSILFFPILFALILSTEYKFGQESLTKLLTPKWQTILTGQICSGIIVASTLTVALSLINSAMLYVMLDETLQNYLSLGLVLEVTLRIIIFAITLTLLSMFLVKITRKPIPSVIVIVSILIITLSGILKVVSPTLENLLPLIGAKSFVFGRVENNNPSEMYGLLLLSQASIVTILLYIKGWYKNQKDKKYG
ncbi:TPA: hypothetical protein ACJVYQ_000218 [Streptococcus pneumoniae]|nr:hypothetical protein [Streptococcus pneumoniae]